MEDQFKSKPVKYDATGRMIRSWDDDKKIDEENKVKHTIDTFLPRIFGDEGLRYTNGRSAPNAIDPDHGSKIGLSVQKVISYRLFHVGNRKDRKWFICVS